MAIDFTHHIGGLDHVELGRLTHMILEELDRAMRKHPSTTDSPHHHFAVLDEERDELWDAIKADDLPHAHKEAVQVGAMALRFLLEAKR